MTSTHVPALDSTVGQTNCWLAVLASDLHTDDRHLAYSALRAVLHALRDQLTPEQSAHLSAQLPISCGRRSPSLELQLLDVLQDVVQAAGQEEFAILLV